MATSQYVQNQISEYSKKVDNVVQLWVQRTPVRQICAQEGITPNKYYQIVKQVKKAGLTQIDKNEILETAIQMSLKERANKQELLDTENLHREGFEKYLCFLNIKIKNFKKIYKEIKGSSHIVGSKIQDCKNQLEYHTTAYTNQTERYENLYDTKFKFKPSKETLDEGNVHLTELQNKYLEVDNDNSEEEDSEEEDEDNVENDTEDQD